ncbi:MAG: hypothetical protein ACK45H_08650 [Bacteroidota bacterium]
MRKITILAAYLITVAFVNAQKINRDPDPRKDFSNVFWKRKYTLFDLMTDKPIFPKEKDGQKLFTIYYSSSEDPRPYKATFTESELERHLFYKFKNKRSCMKFCRSKRE